MCTVTFLPAGLDKFILTSNRDEAPSRTTIEPQQYTVGTTQLVFPKDVEAGGTWIGLSKKKRLICLLNGGFVAHKREANYRQSRGVVVTDLLVANNVFECINTYNFKNIEPFTIIVVDWSINLQLHELVWDGTQAHFQEKPLAPHIWSSSLLYTQDVKKERENWFSKFLFTSLRPSSAEILKFHTTAGVGDLSTNLIMDRTFVKTKSITQIVKDDTEVLMRYEDLQTKKITKITL